MNIIERALSSDIHALAVLKAQRQAFADARQQAILDKLDFVALKLIAVEAHNKKMSQLLKAQMEPSFEAELAEYTDDTCPAGSAPKPGP